jgi:hypothetical protein
MSPKRQKAPTDVGYFRRTAPEIGPVKDVAASWRVTVVIALMIGFIGPPPWSVETVEAT